jgi:hypothetical protein
LPEFNDFGPVVGPGDDSAQGDSQNIKQIVALGAQQARVGHLAQVLQQVLRGALG